MCMLKCLKRKNLQARQPKIPARYAFGLPESHSLLVCGFYPKPLHFPDDNVFAYIKLAGESPHGDPRRDAGFDTVIKRFVTKYQSPLIHSRLCSQVTRFATRSHRLPRLSGLSVPGL